MSKRTASQLPLVVVGGEIIPPRAGLDLPGKLARTSWQLPDSMSFEGWLACGRALFEIEQSHAWWIGDWWRFGEAYGERVEAIEALSINRDYARNCGWVADAIDVSRRRDTLSFGHHQAVAAFPPASQDEYLQRAIEGNDGEPWSLREFRFFLVLERRRLKHDAIRNDQAPAQHTGPFPLIYADPPWRFAVYSELGKDKAPDEHYPTLSDEEISSLTVFGKSMQQLANEDAACFMWCTSANMKRATAVLAAWGFEYKTHAIWVKDRTGTGYVFLNQHEVLLYGTRGEMPAPLSIPSSVFALPRGEHSAKPAEIRQTIETMYPRFGEADRIELFARGSVPGWTTFGYEAT